MIEPAAMTAKSSTPSQVAGLEKGNILEDPRVFALLDEGCNRTCHGERWRKNAQYKLQMLGRSLGPLIGDPKTYSGLGQTRSLGRRSTPWSVLMSNGVYLGGALTSNEVKNSKDAQERKKNIANIIATSILRFLKIVVSPKKRR